MSQERFSGLALLLIKNKRAKTLDFRTVIQQFASAKARRKNFKFPCTPKLNYGNLLNWPQRIVYFISLCLLW